MHWTRHLSGLNLAGRRYFEEHDPTACLTLALWSALLMCGMDDGLLPTQNILVFTLTTFSVIGA